MPAASDIPNGVVPSSAMVEMELFCPAESEPSNKADDFRRPLLTPCALVHDVFLLLLPLLLPLLLLPLTPWALAQGCSMESEPSNKADDLRRPLLTPCALVHIVVRRSEAGRGAAAGNAACRGAVDDAEPSSCVGVGSHLDLGGIELLS